MSSHLRFEFCAKTDVGRVRKQNEDAVAVCEALQLAILADGMGGYNAGEVASSIATAAIQEAVERHLRENPYSHPEDQPAVRRLCLMQAVRQANSAIIEAARHEPEYRGMGTTVVLAWFQQDCVSIAHVGDSRAYLIRAGEIEQLTRDHSLVQEQIEAGLLRPEQVAFAMNRNVITRAVGVDHQLTVEIHEHPLQAESIYLLCSDGLSDRLSSARMVSIVNAANGNMEMACNALIQAANAGGGQDNVSVILIKAIETSPPHQER